MQQILKNEVSFENFPIKRRKKKKKIISILHYLIKIRKIVISELRFRIDIINADIYQIYLYLQENHVKYPATKLTNARLFSNKHLLQQEIYPSPRIPSRKPITQAQWLKFLDSYTRYLGKPPQSLRYWIFFFFSFLPPSRS